MKTLKIIMALGVMAAYIPIFYTGELIFFIGKAFVIVGCYIMRYNNVAKREIQNIRSI